MDNAALALVSLTRTPVARSAEAQSQAFRTDPSLPGPPRARDGPVAMDHH
jgi:hypothetical protein